MRGKPPQQLSAHYQLDCDYGTQLITIYKEGDGGNPVYLCESHATAMGRSYDGGVAGVRLLETLSAGSDTPTEHDDPTQTLEPTAAKPSPSAPSEIVGSPAAAKVVREKVHAVLRDPVRESAYGNSAKALVDETIWNVEAGNHEAYRTALIQGKSTTEAAQAAGGQLAFVHRKIIEYTLKIEALLSDSKATISVRDVIDNPLDGAMLQIISNTAMGDTEKDAAIEHLGGFQERINRELNREITPLQAYRFARAIGDHANWGATSCLSEELKLACRQIYGSVRAAVRAAVPDSHDLEERLANLYVAKANLENAPEAELAEARKTNLAEQSATPKLPQLAR